MSLVGGLPFKFTFTFPTVSSALKVRVLTSIPTPPIDPSLLFFHAATVIILQLPMLCSLTSFFMNKFMFLETDNIICSGRGKLQELWFFEGVFFYLVFFRRHWRFTGKQEKEGAIFIPLGHFHPLQNIQSFFVILHLRLPLTILITAHVVTRMLLHEICNFLQANGGFERARPSH